MALNYLVIFAVTVRLFMTSYGNGQQSCNFTHPCGLEAEGGGTMTEPRQLRSSDGVLNITLVVDVGDYTAGWLTLRRRMYNGSVAAPTWNVKRGDRVQVTLINKLAYPNPEFKPNVPRFPNTTNLHVHGLHVSSKTPSDDPFVRVYPGEQFTYTYHIHAEQSPGTFWYHPHVHGSSLLQVLSGMAGIIIVEDNESSLSEQLRSVSCPFNCENDIQLLFQPILLLSDDTRFSGFIPEQKKIGDQVQNLRQYQVSSGGTFEEWARNKSNGINYFTTNGKLQPVLEIQTGQIKRFRMVNAGGASTIELEIVDTSGGGNACEVYEIALDGIYLNEARRPRLGKSFFMPATRIDWLVVCNQPGNYTVRSNPAVEDGLSVGDEDRWKGDLFTILVNGDVTTTEINTTLPQRPSYLRDFRDVPQEDVHGRFVVQLGPRFTLNREVFQYKHNFRYKMEVNKLQEWHFINTSPILSHAMHMHVNHFQIIHFQPYTGPIGVFKGLDWKLYDQNSETCFYQHPGYNKASAEIPPFSGPLIYSDHYKRWLRGGNGSLSYPVSGDFMDTVWVPPLSNLTIRFLPNELTGIVLVHCHLLAHADEGMAITVDVVNSGEDLTAAVAADGAYPGACHECDPYPFNAPSRCNSSSASTRPDYSFVLLCLLVIWAIWTS